MFALAALERSMTDRMAVPPEIATWWGTLAAVTVTMPEYAPGTWGAKVTLMVQLAPAASMDPQLFVWVKPRGTVTLLIPTGARVEL